MVSAFVPTTYLSLLTKLQTENGWQDVRAFNKFFRSEYPDIPRSTRERWVRVFLNGAAHDTTPSWHIRTEEPKSIVDRRFSALANGRYKEERRRWELEKTIRYVNWSCWHRPLGDGAILSLAMQIVDDFNPNVVPVMSDFLHMNRFSQHAPKPASFVPETNGEVVKVNKIKEFLRLSEECIGMVKACAPKATLLNLWGNHENWVLRDMLAQAMVGATESDLAEFVIDQVFEKLDSLGALWCEMDERRYLPLTEHFWVGHGHLARAGEGATAKAYLNKFKGAVSFAGGHAHRQEVLWATTPVNRHFVAMAGTLGLLRNIYNAHDFVNHNWGFQLIEHPFEGWRGVEVTDVNIFYEKGYYIAKCRGKEYSEKAVFEYDPLLDLVETGA